MPISGVALAVCHVGCFSGALDFLDLSFRSAETTEALNGQHYLLDDVISRQSAVLPCLLSKTACHHEGNQNDFLCNSGVGCPRFIYAAGCTDVKIHKD